MNNKNIFCTIKEFIGDNKLRAYASTITPDRDGEVVLPNAYVGSKKSFMQNPVLLQFHNYWDEPVGKITSLDHDDFGMIMEVEFAPTEAGKKFATLYKGGFMNAFSIGFIPKKSIRPSDSGDELAQLGLSKDIFNKEGVYRIFTEIELLEVSCVPVPANRDAIVLSAKSLASKDASAIEDIIAELKALKKEFSKDEDADVKGAEDVVEDVVEDVDAKETDGANDKGVEDVEDEEVEDVEDEESEGKDVDITSTIEQLASVLVEKLMPNIISEIEASISDIITSMEGVQEDLVDYMDKQFNALYKTSLKANKQEKQKDPQEDVLKAIFEELKSIKPLG
jgi:HK97 family phage prohead protease